MIHYSFFGLTVLTFSSRPDLADQHKVGFFGLDRASQTDVTEVVDLKEMTEVLQVLLKVNTHVFVDSSFHKAFSWSFFIKHLKMTVGLTKGRNLCRYNFITCAHFGQSEDWISCVALATPTCNVWHISYNTLAQICQSIRYHFKLSVNTFILNYTLKFCVKTF